MSAPTTSARPVAPQGRPARPVRRAAPARGPQPRPGTTWAHARGATTATAGATARATAGATARATAGATALAVPAQDPAATPAPGPRSRIRLLERPRTGSRRVGFAVTCTAMLGALMLGLLLLNVAISGNAFTISELQSERSVLVDRQQALEQRLLVEGSPSSLAVKARALGMVPAPQVIVLAPDGTGAPPVAPAP